MTRWSLRARLVVGLVTLAAVGMLMLAAVTYAEQRSFLMQRVDSEVRKAPQAMETYLAAHGIGGPPRDVAPAYPGGGHDDHGGPGGGPAGPQYTDLPTGTYGERRTASGTVVGGTTVSLMGSTTARPALAAKLPIDTLFTVNGRGGDKTRYRVIAHREPTGALTVVAVPLRSVDQTLHRLLLVELLVVAAVLLVLAVAGRWVVGVGLRPLVRMERTAEAIAGGDLARRVSPAGARTEVGRLGLALNNMLERLERAFAERQASEDRLRRFLADASHELRTPLASIRGYAELWRMGAAREPAEVGKSMRRIEEESGRMGSLVDDLLTLARLDELAEAPHGEVDLARLARDAVDDARAIAPDREIAVEAPGRLPVDGDAHQLRQVLGNLVRNALLHTPAGTPVEVSAEREDGQAVVRVRDHGRGLPQGVEPSALFERFWRAEGGRERGRGGAGLGLAIVAEIVAAHDGRVTAADVEGGGAEFTVRVPAAQVD